MTRNERRTLLGVSAAVITMVVAGLVPTKISALGIEFDPGDQRTLVHMARLIVGYFLLTFIVYAWSDYHVWRSAAAANWNAWRAYRLDPLIGPVLEQREERARTSTLFTGRRWYARPSALIVSSARSLIDFWLPVIIGFVAILASVLFVPTKPTVGRAGRGVGTLTTQCITGDFVA